MNKRLLRWVAGIGVILGSASTIVIGSLGAPPPKLQNWLQDPAVDAVIAMLALGTAASLITWARQSDNPDDMALALALIIDGVLIVIMNIIAPVMGWWHGPYFETRLIPLALLHFSAPMPFGLLLLGYRWLAARQRWLAAALYALLALLMIPGIMRLDNQVLENGWFDWGNGYQLWHDVLLGVILFVIPPILYEAFSRSWRRTRLQPAV